MNKKHIILIVLFINLLSCHAQDWIDGFTPPAPRTSKQNTSQLFGGIALQAAGIGICAGSGYLMWMYPEEMGELSTYGIMFGGSCAVVGTGLIVRSVSNMITARKSIHNMKKERKDSDVSLIIGPTNYGVGIVCRF
jgi:hypothetical protein